MSKNMWTEWTERWGQAPSPNNNTQLEDLIRKAERSVECDHSVTSDDKLVTVSIDVPGMSVENGTIEVDSTTVYVSWNHRGTRRSRTINLGKRVDFNSATASVHDGILTVVANIDNDRKRVKLK